MKRSRTVEKDLRRVQEWRRRKVTQLCREIITALSAFPPDQKPRQKIPWDPPAELSAKQKGGAFR